MSRFIGLTILAVLAAYGAGALISLSLTEVPAIIIVPPPETGRIRTVRFKRYCERLDGNGIYSFCVYSDDGSRCEIGHLVGTEVKEGDKVDCNWRKE